MAAQRKPEVWRIMKAALEGVKSKAAMMRSPSFSRLAASRTTMKEPLPVNVSQCLCSALGWWRDVTECLNGVRYAVEG
jgi:hypothetical protein